MVFCEIQAIFPNITVFDIAVLLHLEVIGNRGKIPLIASKDASYRIGKTGVWRHICCIIDSIGENAGLFGLPLLIGKAIEDLLLLAQCGREGDYEGQVEYLPL